MTEDVRQTLSTERVPEWCIVFHRPVPDRILAWYRMGRLKRTDEATLETHLLLCPICQLQLGDLRLPAPINQC